MSALSNTGIETRRHFLKNSLYMAPALLVLGSLEAQAHSGEKDCNSGHKSSSYLSPKNCNSGHQNSCDHKGNNGFGNGDQDAPGHSLHHNNAENSQKTIQDPQKCKVNNVGVDTHGGHEKDMDENGKKDDGHNGSSCKTK
ncbi:hypothetical protein [Malikia sp.]|uniref:hypothetical protein n=1 Tax=Malikia sp. TaxID=2070706 RepID=UPI00260EBF3A|nr:hypothetical protein [Malikia sp.]MDD2730486.1 hypothetical protein [Malikia sp.]